MAILRFDPNKPLEVALKFAEGKQVPSRIEGAPDQMMYTLCGDDRIYVPLHVAGTIAKLGIKPLELMSICKTVQGKVTEWEVKRIGDNTTQPIPTPTENAQQAQSPAKASPAAQPGPTVVSMPEQSHPSAVAALRTRTLTQVLSGCMKAAIDTIAENAEYARSKGVPVTFSEQSIQDLTSTGIIHLQRMAELECRYEREYAAIMARQGGAKWAR